MTEIYLLEGSHWRPDWEVVNVDRETGAVQQEQRDAKLCTTLYKGHKDETTTCGKKPDRTCEIHECKIMQPTGYREQQRQICMCSVEASHTHTSSRGGGTRTSLHNGPNGGMQEHSLKEEHDGQQEEEVGI